MPARPCAVAGVVVVASALLLSGCAAPPEVDQEAAQAWMDETIARADGRSDILGTFAGSTTTADGGTTLTFDVPVDLTGVELSCFGGGSASFGITTTAVGSSTGWQTEVDCTDEPHLIEVGLDGADTLTGVTSTTATATRSDPATTYVVTILGTQP
ncbi:hypothetical protein JOD63_001969 [Microbacterium terrae]|uniref:Uncharacterized protein n=1 Tax=Microbacterium terrae TaxID=69369 RepID=A0A0M2HC75_9MICO|nr:hypothetical protein [Microbacterium terrae]KJL41708.1 hypothetical protein RS81_01293 [Microbacterium terrae]MBP1078001.1 hypothetical protein [Microbacterium terrae]GLK00170.1 hypothetical protein GCM10017594_33670 [Microbacterium terrae]